MTQRPAEIDPTILSQCNTVFALRMSNDRDQAIVKSAISDTGSGLLEFLSALGQREAIAFGDGVTLPVRIRFDDLPAHAMPRSSSAMFTTMWQQPSTDTSFLEQIVDKWRYSISGAEGSQATAMFADAMGLTTPGAVPAAPVPQPALEPPARRYSMSGPDATSREAIKPRLASEQPAYAQAPAGPSPASPPPAAAPAQGSSALRSLRDRLNQRGGSR